MTDENIISFPAEDSGVVERPAVEVIDGFASPCHHFYVTISAKNPRELRCRNCKGVVDPYTFLLGWANRLANRQATQRDLVARMGEVRTHALADGDYLTVCGIGRKDGGFGRPMTVRVTSEEYRVDCRRCREKLQRGAKALFEERP